MSTKPKLVYNISIAFKYQKQDICVMLKNDLFMGK